MQPDRDGISSHSIRKKVSLGRKGRLTDSCMATKASVWHTECLYVLRVLQLPDFTQLKSMKDK